MDQVRLFSHYTGALSCAARSVEMSCVASSASILRTVCLLVKMLDTDDVRGVVPGNGSVGVGFRNCTLQVHHYICSGLVA
jgi:hypothetical protein